MNSIDGGAVIGMFASAFEDIQRVRKSLGLRAGALERGGLDGAPAFRIRESEMQKIEEQFARDLGRELRHHVLWSWLSQHPGIGGPLMARVLAVIRDPFRFPGRPCSTQGHISSSLLPLGDRCPFVDKDGTECDGVLLETRNGTGVRSLWHFGGFHVVEGKMPRRAKGIQSDWNTRLRTLFLQPDGIADQVIRHRTPVYRDRYDSEKARILLRFGADTSDEIGEGDGADAPGAEADSEREYESEPTSGKGLRGRAHKIARVIVAKAILADMLMEWKRRPVEIRDVDGELVGGIAAS